MGFSSAGPSLYRNKKNTKRFTRTLRRMFESINILQLYMNNIHHSKSKKFDIGSDYQKLEKNLALHLINKHFNVNTN